MTDLTKLVKPLEWHEGDEPHEWKSGPYDVWHELGKFQVYWWAIALGKPHDTEADAMAAANAHNAARIIAAMDQGALPAMVRAAERRGYERGIDASALRYRAGSGPDSWDYFAIAEAAIIDLKSFNPALTDKNPQSEYDRKVAQMKEDFPNGF